MNVGNRFDVDKIGELNPGKTTVVDATKLLGDPSSRSALPDGEVLLEWNYSTGSPMGGSAGHASIVFDRQGRMVRIDHISSVE